MGGTSHEWAGVHAAVRGFEGGVGTSVEVGDYENEILRHIEEAEVSCELGVVRGRKNFYEVKVCNIDIIVVRMGVLYTKV